MFMYKLEVTQWDWRQNIEMDVQVGWINFAQNRYEWRAPVNTVETISLPKNEKDLLTRQENISFSIMSFFNVGS